MAQQHLAIQPRLQAIADMVPQGTRLADVGTDHGYLPIRLLQDGRITAAVATEIVPGPLEHGKRTAAACGMSERIAFRLCDGLQDVSPMEVDTVVIAGMGGETIAGILDAVPWAREKTLLLQPMTRSELLRPWLARHGYAIRREELVLDKGHIYPILQAAGGSMPPPSPGERYYGFSDPDGPLFAPYLRGWIRRVERAVKGIRLAQRTEQAERLKSLEAVLSELYEKERSLCVP